MTMYAAVKWPVNATSDEVWRIVSVDLPILALTLRDEHGFDPDEIYELFEDAANAAEVE